MTEAPPGPQTAQTMLPPWAPEEHPLYDSHVGSKSVKWFECLRRGSSFERREFVLDPRAAHREIYGALTPDGFPEYAGTYRGTPGTSLEHRAVALHSHTGRSSQDLQVPHRVPHDMTGFYARWTGEYFELVGGLVAQEALEKAARLFYGLGRIHPFLDGNGHIQRLAFAALLFERVDLELDPKWTIHPRPYGIDFANALEGVSTRDGLPRLQRLLGAYVRVKS